MNTLQNIAYCLTLISLGFAAYDTVRKKDYRVANRSLWLIVVWLVLLLLDKSLP